MRLTRGSTSTTPAKPPARARLDALVSGASRALLWERLWPALWPPITVVLAFLTASWLGLWLDLTPLWKQVGLAAFGLLFLASLYPLLRVRPPPREEALDRLDRDSPVGHRPARSFEDSLALGTDDPASRALWDLHRKRAEAAIRRLEVAPPHPNMPRRDPRAFRAAALVAAVAALFVAGPEAGRRIGAAFDWRGPAEAGAMFRVDGWIDPPHYTRLPPLMIDLAAGEQHLKAPVGSTLVIRVAGRGEAQLQPGPGLAPLKGADDQKPDLKETRFKITGSTDLGIKTGLTGGMRLLVEAIPDRPPEVAIAGPPEVNARGTFSLAYTMKDDYGIGSAEGLVEKPEGAGRRSLVPPPRIALTLPADPRSGEETKAGVDLTAHPWAGARVKITLVAKDEADQEGRSATIDFTLPQRPFTKPLAKALVEQRRNIILDPDNRRPVQIALDSLLIAPERFTPEWGVFLGLRAASDRFRRARNDAALTEVADWLWAMALQIEEGDLSDAERELRAAQERLREAMERGAGEQEIARLSEELRQAMDRFLREFAERMQNQPQDNQQQSSRALDRTISQDDLNRMLNEMQDAMRRGDMAEAQRLLDQLKNILENLRTARPNSRMSDPMAREMNRQMEDMDDMIREQQQLRDETFRQGQNRRDRQGTRQGQRQRGPGQRQQPGQQSQQGQEGEEGEQEGAENGQEGQEGQGLSRRQQALRERLQEMQRRMRGMGMQGEQGLSDAEGAMREAEGQLGQGREGSAVESQGRALEGLQRGMQGMAQQMQRMMGQNEGEGEGGEPTGPGNPQGRAQNDPRNDDPLGRPTRSREFSDGRVRIPGVNESAVERARRILEELRRKLGDPTRPQEELDYFERLLRRN
ncbi:TIGR02302 family protein [Enterovirga sp. CN4-39]|uniref:TIGR02302 family protein n=1 Tax=Enterovirga sp. CN4-39 TaxID=3400910 RepID=UPI003C09C04E